MAGGSNAAATGAATSLQTHCGHVLRPSAAGGCMNAPASVAPTAARNSASALSMMASAVVVAVSMLTF
jgi:hypothetical protein